MPCEDCQRTFTILRRKKSCGECKRIFCSGCLKSRPGNLVDVCGRCIVLTKRPICVNDLNKLKPKDLIFYLQSKHISTAGCVEKDELVNLVVIYANNSQINGETTQQQQQHQQQSHQSTSDSNPFEQIRQTCSSFLNTFTDKIVSDIKDFQNSPFKSTSQPSSPPASAPPHSPPQTQQPRRSSQGPSNVVPPSPPHPAPHPAGPSRVSSSSTSSSFEEIGAVGGQTPSDPGVDGNQWQFLNGNNNNNDQHSGSTGAGASGGGGKEKPSAPSFRRHSDSDLRNKTTHELEGILRDIDNPENRHKKCEKCNEDVKIRIAALRLQLEEPNATIEENRQHLNDFLVYLETDNRHSVPHSPEERQICDELTVNLEPKEPSPPNLTPTQQTQPPPQEPKHFDRTKRVNLGDISAIEDFDQLSVKQLKEILTLNRVDYKGCCEKDELKERVKRLWRNHTAATSADPDLLPSDELCKICMDAPIECVILECGHLVACLQCSKVLSECPVCRQYITRVVRFFKV